VKGVVKELKFGDEFWAAWKEAKQRHEASKAK